MKDVKKKVDTLLIWLTATESRENLFRHDSPALAVQREDLSQEITKGAVERIEVRKESRLFGIHHISDLQ
ncbi:MAG: hypothetical protein PHP95_12440 [Desulfuromonadaceae bacterium]|nr:hypothetical protein [Desulfuromonadaceae bacterium]MDD2849252.1 hypothetical protein [Desulfuromonadaceae bacterium]MDD4131879.1 hypothetical protein [Desulfuromonadaceae bacterium]